MGISDDIAKGLEVEVRADRDTVRRLARTAATQAGGWTFGMSAAGKFKVTEKRAAERGLTFVVTAPNGRGLMEFLVEDSPGVNGGTVVRVGIGDHLTSQTRTSFGIPADRKRVAGFPAYEKFVRGFSAALAGSGY